MHKKFWSRWSAWVLAAAVCAVCANAVASPQSAAALQAKYLSLVEPLQRNQFQRALVLDSSETPERISGDVYAVVQYPFGVVRASLDSPQNWCDVISLHVNTKYCRPIAGPTGTILRVHIGKKTAEELAATPRVDFSYSTAATTPELMDVRLGAKDGPLGTSDYRIALEAVALPNGRTFVHLNYSYAVSFAGRLALQTYLGTIGSGKVGFTVVGRQGNGQPDYVAGVRGLVERNTMRYYLAIDSFLESAAVPPPAQLEQRLQSWFSAVERYPRQLHEVDRDAYLQMKYAEFARQQTVQ